MTGGDKRLAQDSNGFCGISSGWRYVYGTGLLIQLGIVLGWIVVWTGIILAPSSVSAKVGLRPDVIISYRSPFHDVLVRNEIYFVGKDINFVTNEFFFS